MVNCTKLESKKQELYSSVYGRRIYAEIKYLYEVALNSGEKFDELFDKAIDLVALNTVDEKTVLQAEEILKPIKNTDKVKEIIYVAHAHIDMNWEWGWDETVAVTLSTFRTMLDFMAQYDFTFGQSQASCYKIVEDYDPEMLKEIKQRIKEGKWEVTASSWVEGDSNMPLPETQLRQFLYAKKYLSSLLDIGYDDMCLAFEPDTFGHQAFEPELLNSGGIKWMYYGRGNKDEAIMRWRSKSGAEVLAYLEPLWYMTEIVDSDLRSALRFAPSFANRYNIDRCLQVIGVGDHGGGVTRESLETVEEMKSYPLLPKIKFGTYREFFEYLESKKDNFKVYCGELNPVFDGCYTSQARIKKAFKESEVNLLTTESLNAMAAMDGQVDRENSMEGAWRDLLFNTFHDILPGSCVYDSKVYSLGLMQNANAKAESVRALALRDIAEKIDFTVWEKELQPVDGLKSSIGAGVGIKGNIRCSYDISRSDGKGRVYVFFNQLPFDRECVVELPVFDWNVDVDNLEAVTESGESLEIQVLSKAEKYWLHGLFRILVKVKLPSLGYQSILLRQRDLYLTSYSILSQCSTIYIPRLQVPCDFNLENENYKIEFNPKTLNLKGIFNKNANSYLPIVGGGGLWYSEEESLPDSAWRIGRIKKEEEILPCKTGKVYSGQIRKGFNYTAEFSTSSVSVDVQLEGDALIYKVSCDFTEINKSGAIVPMFSYALKLKSGVEVYKDFNERGRLIESTDMDFCASRCVFVKCMGGCNFLLVSKDKYGFRYFDDKLSLTLLRSPVYPDRYTEYGKYEMEFAIIPCADYTEKQMDEVVRSYVTPAVFTSVTGRGSCELPLSDKFITFNSTSSVISDISTDGNGNIKIAVRNYGEKRDSCMVGLKRKIKAVYLTDCHLKISDNIKSEEQSFKFEVKPYGLTHYLIEI